MIIRYQVIQTLEASSLSNRGVRSTPGQMAVSISTLTESPTNTNGVLIQSAQSHHLHHPQVVPTYGYCATTLVSVYCTNMLIVNQPNVFRKSSICHISLTTYSQTFRVSKLKTATMGKILNGRLFRINGKAFSVNGEVFRVHGKLLHIVFSSC